jgi:hypothetical protein
VFTELAYCWTAFTEDWISDENSCVALLKSEVSCCVTNESIYWPVLIALVIEFRFGLKNVDTMLFTMELMFLPEAS